MTWLHWLVDAQALTPHGFCLLWQPALLWLDATADAAIMLAYFSIPMTLLWFARKRPDLPHRWIAVLFVAFIVACGLTHGLSILTLWVAAYKLEAAGKVVTAGLSIVTAIALWPLVPKLLALPSPGQMARLNDELRATLAEQQATAAQLRHSQQQLLLAQQTLQQEHDLLEQHVAERTAALEASTASLRETQALMERIKAMAGVGGWKFDPATRTGFCSERACRILGLAGSVQPTLAAAIELFTPEARPVIRAAVERALAGQGGWDLELACVRGDGRPIWLRTVGALELMDGRTAILVGAVQDVTERVAERQALQSALERLSLATESCGIGIWDWDLVRDVTVWDARVYALFGIDPQVTPDEALWRRHLHPQDRDGIEQAIAEAVAGSKPYDLEYRIVRADGSVRYIHATARVTRDAADRVVRLIGADQDVTERHLAEEMRLERDAADRATRAKSEFLATMSHEIRSPMSGLMGVLDMLRATSLDAEQSRMAGMIHNSGSMLLAVLNDILDFSKIEAGALSINMEPTALRQLLDDLVQPHALSAASKGLRLTLAVAPDVPDAIMTDPLRLRQILGNLLSNAMKFTAAGDVSLQVRPLRDGPLPALCCVVQDSGIGIPEAALARLFQPFTQADGSTTRHFGGTGLGLSISRRLAHLMDGDIAVTSRPGAGSEFTVTLPLLPCATEAAMATARDAAAATPCLPGRGRALVVDDDITLRWLSQRQLEKLGFTVDHAADGAAGFEKLLARPYDLLLTDCHMPHMDGAALTRAVRAAADPALRRMPIIGVTADVTEAQRERCALAGMTDLAIKPLTVEGLAQLLRRHLSAQADAPDQADAQDGDAAAPEAPALRPIVFDDQIYLTVFGPGEPEGARWLQDYLETAAQDQAALARLVTDAPGGDAMAEITRLAHRLAGASFSVGAMLHGDAARALEAAARAGDPAAVQRCHAALCATHADAAAAIDRFLFAAEMV